MSDVVKILVEMGFSETKSQLAVTKTGARDVESAMEWLLAHQDEEEQLPDSDSANAGESSSTISEQAETAESTTAEARSLKCDECGRLFKNTTEIEFHAAKSGHSSFSESSEEKKPLSEEERDAQKARLEELIKQKRKDREEQEKIDAIEREKLRIRSGKELSEARKKQEDAEMKKVIDARKREKMEEKIARQRVRDQIEQDKLARREKFGGQPPVECSAKPTASVIPVVAPVTSPVSKTYSEAKLQIRLTNGTALTQTFGAKEPLSAVRLFIEMNRTDGEGPFSLMTSFPRKVFNLDDYDKPLDVLGLAPAAVIIVTKS